MSKLRPWQGVECFSKMRLSVGLDYISCNEEKASQDQLAKRKTEKVQITGNKVGGKVYNSTANKKGWSNYSDATKRRLEDGWPDSMSSARGQVILASSLRKFL